jgi:hypothetical protein
MQKIISFLAAEIIVCKVYDCFLECQTNAFFPTHVVAKVANATTDMELTGMSMAATTGERCPERA